MMTIEDFEKKIQNEIDTDLSIRVNPNAEDIAGVYYKDIYVGVAVPPKEIYEELSMSRTDAVGQPYKTIDFAFDLIEGKLKKIKATLTEDPDFFNEE